MKSVIDNLNVITGWSGTATIYGLNDHSDYIAGYNSKSLILYFNSLNSYVEKTYDEDVSDYDTLTLYLISRNKRKGLFNKISDFDYKIDLGTGKEFYLHTWREFTFITVNINDIDTLDRIRITSLHDDSDYLIISYLVVSKDEIPLDIFIGLQEAIEDYRDDKDTYLIGTGNFISGDSTINLEDMNFVDDYATIKIDDGNNNEIHQLFRGKEGIFKLTDLYDGNTVVNSYNGANVYLYFPIEYGRETLEAIVPGITIWGFEPIEKLTSFKEEDLIDSWTDTGPSSRKVGLYMEYPIQIECEARQNEILAYLAEIIRSSIGRETFYINGKKSVINFDGGAQESSPDKDFNFIPKILYRGIVEIQEEIWERNSLPLITTTNIQVQIQ